MLARVPWWALICAMIAAQFAYRALSIVLAQSESEPVKWLVFGACTLVIATFYGCGAEFFTRWYPRLENAVRRWRQPPQHG